uniref:ARID domain-containing protein n=1 Tax=Glossina morsitans morsitans TaxID=37546 RepID=A0A1B0FBV2_GLOMM
MVVSKDSKRKRKESSPPPQQQSSTTIESSPEMPKRTKVQAQRKFAQGQNAPQSSYNSILASSSSNTGPSTSSESREPPTEILPNKRPKTEDFLTFLCFRGTSALPPHLDFLNQGKSKEPPRPVKKPPNKKSNKKGKKGRPPKTVKADDVKDTSTAEKNITDAEKAEIELNTSGIAINNSGERDKIEEKIEERVETNDIPTFAVRKRAEVVAEGNRRSNNNVESEKCNNSADTTSRRSNRSSLREAKVVLEQLPDDVEEALQCSIVDETSKPENSDDENKEAKTSKSTSKNERSSETPSKDSDTAVKLRKGKTTANNQKKLEIETRDIGKASSKAEPKEKVAIKRPRQKESPIFIPSPEPSGRMTRQRAFFEPVKVPPKENSQINTVNDVENSTDSPPKEKTDITIEDEAKTMITKKEESAQKKTVQNENVLEEKIENTSASNVDGVDKTKADMNVFDFSSEDEQPLAKAIKFKKVGISKTNTRKGQRGNKKSASKRATATKTEKNADRCKSKEKESQKSGALQEELVEAERNEEQKDESAKFKGKRGASLSVGGKNSKQRRDVEERLDETDKDVIAQSPKKPTNIKQGRKKTKAENESIGELETDDNPNSPPVRNQRPSRKTKEAATIYMGIIGHRLQLGDDEDDDISLSSFDRPNVREMEKMENELKRNITALSKHSSTSPIPAAKQMQLPEESPPPAASTINVEKPCVGRRGRPPKSQKQMAAPPAKREIEGMLVKKGVLSKITQQTESTSEMKEGKTEQSKTGTEEDEDFLLNEELNETKRKLEKSFSDSDDEPLAIKANAKTSDKDVSEQVENAVPAIPAPVPSTSDIKTLTMLPLTTKPITTVPTPPPPTTTLTTTTSSFGVTNAVTSPTTSSVFPPAPVTPSSQTPSPFKVVEKKSPVPTSKILNVPATYGIPSASPTGNLGAAINNSFGKTSMYVPQSPAHYHSHTSHIRSQYPGQSTKSPVMPPASSATASHLTTSPQLNAQSPLKYQTPPTTYPPPIEAYPSPKINPNFLTPKFDRNTLPRPTNLTGNHNSFPSPSPVKFDMSGSSSGLLKNSSLSQANVTASSKTLYTANVGNNIAGASTSATAAANQSGNDPLKDEIGSILAANLMPSKEESGKIFGIASVSLAQSSGPDNTKCTLGKCGSIHKPVLGPVVPTESYIGDQLSGKERRKAKVNMTHEQIHKWLIECSSNPDEIQDDLEDDFDSDLRPNNYSTTPPPTRDDKESTSFSSSSKATRDLGKSESAWSAKGPSLKATPVVASSSSANNRKDDLKLIEPTSPPDDDLDKASPIMNLAREKTAENKQTPSPASIEEKSLKIETRKNDKKLKEEKSASKEPAKQAEMDSPQPKSSSMISKQAAGHKVANQKKLESPITTTTAAPNKSNRKKISIDTINEKPINSGIHDVSINIADNMASNTANRTPKRTPVYQQKQVSKQQRSEFKETTTTSHKKSAPFSYGGAFSADNEKSIYSFDKDDVDDVESNKPTTYRRQSRRDSQQAEAGNGGNTTPTTSQRTSPSKKRTAAAVEKANKDLANASQASSVSLTLSPTEKSKLVKVSLDTEAVLPVKPATNKSGKGTKKTVETIAPTNDADSDSADGHTFYIPLQGIGTSGDGEGGIQGVAVKLGREGPDGPNQKVIMHATLVTKAQMGANSKPLPESMNVSDIVKNLMSGGDKKTATATNVGTTVSTNSAPNSLKNVPVGTVQPRFKGDTSNQGPSTSTAGGGLVRVNSNSSLFSGSVKSRNATAPSGAPVTSHGANKKLKDDTPIKMANNTAFPRHDDPTQMVEAPIFRPTDKEFSDPIEFIERITPIAARFGICKIIPPASFKPECRISDEMRFTAYNQYVHKMLHRWGPSAKELSAIKKYLATQSIVMNHPPWIGGMEVDLPRLYHTVQELGGLKEVIEKKKWARVAEEMCIPKLAQDRVTKLDDIYCKYLLPYDTLSPTERQKLFDEVEADWAKREARARRNADRFVNTESVSNEEDDITSENDEEESEEEVDGVSMECIVKGRSMPLSQFYRIARNTMALWFKNTEPTVNEVEAEFWRHVAVRDSHVCVHSGSIDSSGWGFGFPSPGPKGKGSNYARHPWNLKVMTNNPGSVLRSLGPVMGVTVPTLHVGMLFSACCWYRDPHGLSWIEYLHTGASKLWYGIPDDQSANFRAALTSLIPTHCQNKTIWLPCDTVMVPPHMLTDRGVSLCRIEQKPGEFIVVFPRAYTSSLATGYVVSESVYFATSSWLDLAKDDFRDIHDSCEPAMFSLEQLLFALGYDQRVQPDTLQQMLPMLQEVYEKETAAREQLKAAGVTSTEKVTNEKSGKSKKQQQPPYKSIESECDLCRANLYISMVRTDEGNVYCLQHALKNLNNGNIQAKKCKLIYAYNVDDIENLIKNLKDKIQQKRNTSAGKKQK